MKTPDSVVADVLLTDPARKEIGLSFNHQTVAQIWAHPGPQIKKFQPTAYSKVKESGWDDSRSRCLTQMRPRDFALIHLICLLTLGPQEWRQFTCHDFWLINVDVLECHTPHPIRCVGWILDCDKDKFYNIDLVIRLYKNKGRAREENQSPLYHSQWKQKK